MQTDTDPTAGFVVVKVHQHAAERSRVSRIVLLTFASVDEYDGELVAIVGVVAAAAPDPVGGEIGRTRPRTAAARRHIAFSTRSSYRVQHSGGHQRLPERRLCTPCKMHRRQLVISCL